MAARRRDRPPLHRWTPDFSQLRWSVPAVLPLRCLQTCTAAAALFALLGACGLAPPRSTRVIVRPRAPRTEITIRSVTGLWDATVVTPQGAESIAMSLTQTGDLVTGTLTVRGRTVSSDPSRPAHIDVTGAFNLEFSQTTERIVVLARPDTTGIRISAQVSGLAAQPIVADFVRR
jgi:hypothetical protein